MVDQTGMNKTWDLSLYELHRTPQEAICDNTEIAVCPRSLHSELMCPICLDMLKNTMTTKECLHRFCQECITTALRSGNKECPTCRKKLVSKRSLRPDPNFDMLITKIYPSRDEYEALQEKVLQKLNKNHSNSSFLNSIEEGMKSQQQNRSQRKPKVLSNDDVSNTPVPSAPSTPNPASNGQDSGVQTPNPSSPSPMQVDGSSSSNVRKKQKILQSETDSHSESGMDGVDSAAEGASTHEDPSLMDLELVFKPHPEEMTKETLTMSKELSESSVRFLKTTANATGRLVFYYCYKIMFYFTKSVQKSQINTMRAAIRQFRVLSMDDRDLYFILKPPLGRRMREFCKPGEVCTPM